LLTLSEVTEVSGQEGDFHVSVTQHPRYVDMEKCIACGLCAEKCPKKVPDEYDGGLSKRKAIYVRYAQAVPLKYAIDAPNCIYLTKGKCRACEKFCPSGAIRFDEQPTTRELNVGAIITTIGGTTYNPADRDTYGYTRHPDIVTSIEFERILSSSGPYGGHLLKPSDGKEPRKIAWLQCVGSRDVHVAERGYCSSVCCTYAIKEAMLAKEHGGPDLDTAIFYIDVRAYGKDFERYYNRAKDDAGVRFIRSRITGLSPAEDEGGHVVRYVDEQGRMVEEAFDMVVLSVGLGTEEDVSETARRLGVDLDQYRFADTSTLEPIQTSRPGIYVCGVFQGPKDIPTSVIDSSAAAAAAGGLLAEARWTLTKTKELPAETDIRGQSPRIGVFVCRCGTNIAGVVDVPAVVEWARDLPFVVHAEENLFSCAQDTQDKMAEVIREQGLNRVVVAACTPKTHETLFQETLTNAGVNKYLFEMANIRNQCSWVHRDDPEAATTKAKELVRMAVSKAALLEPLTEPMLRILPSALIIGGGVAGMVAAKNLAEQGFDVHVVEKSSTLGGNARFLQETWRGEDVQAYLEKLRSEVTSNPRIQIHLESSVSRVEGFVGDFESTLEGPGGRQERIAHGVTIIATGARELKPKDFLYGQDPRVMTALDLERSFLDGDPAPGQAETAVFIQCVGSRNAERPYCSKVCCTASIKNALKLKRQNPGMKVFVLYRDMRPYGLREDLYREAREGGVSFLRYDASLPLEVSKAGERLRVAFTDRVLRSQMEVFPDLLVLATATVPSPVADLAQQYKVPLNEDGFFVEAHVKLRPVDFATDGVFVCGLAHGPKPLDESIAQAQAAAARAVTLLSSKEMPVSGTVAWVDQAACSGCGVCVAICPYGAPRFTEESGGKAQIQSTLCKGCGLCVSSCRSGALCLKGFETSQIMQMIQGAV